MVKRCAYGVCNTDSRYSDRITNGIYFVPFPKPKTNIEKCKRWLRLCGRPQDQLNLTILADHSKAKHIYVCSKHFIDGKPTLENPDPEPASRYDTVTPVRPPPKPRPISEPPRKKVRIVLAESFDENQTVEPATETPDSSCQKYSQKELLIASPLDILATEAENRSLTEKLLSEKLKNEELR
ncbi:hypothetical protein ACF0H5_023554 [Mactra antiquata]